MAAAILQELILEVSRDRSEGKTFHEMMQKVIDFLMAQPAGYADGKRDLFLQRANDSMIQFEALKDTARRAPMEERLRSSAFLLTLLSEVKATMPQEPVVDRAAKFQAMIQRHQAEMEQKQAAHRKERLARGLSESAGSAKPEKRILIHALPLPDLDLSVAPKPLEGGIAESVRIVEERYGKEAPILRDLSKSVSTVITAKAVRDQQVLGGLALGASRFGGLPDLPPGEVWPVVEGKKIPFVAQLNLAEFPEAHGVLPAEGHLLVFVLVSNEDGFRPPPVKVMFYPGPAESMMRAPFPDPQEIWPDWCDERVYEISGAGRPPAAGEATKRSRKRGEKLGWLFGKFEFDETPGGIADEGFENGDDWINLLAVMSGGSMQWSDSGHLYLIARKADISRRDFSHVLAVVCSS